MTSSVLLAIRSNLDDLLWRGMEEEGVSPTQFPADWEKGTGKRRWLSAEELQTFLKDHMVSLSIAPVFPGQDTDTFSTDFRSSANVRIYRVAFYLKGLKALTRKPNRDQPVFMSTITHGGREVIVSTRGVRHDFEHDRLDVKHSYHVGIDGRGTVLENGEFVRLSHSDKDSIFGAPGPFATREVNSRDAAWEDLDIGNVTAGYLEFCGTNYAFKSS
ncbi:hypothetical protein AcV5_003034 [Taiwanofungus camphoratus]|nr:hypothetical protein AcV5_003034 [Antrodia cinnamomea]